MTAAAATQVSLLITFDRTPGTRPESFCSSPVMARRRIIEPEQRAWLNDLRIAAPDVDEERHFYACAACHQRVDMRRLGDVLDHEDADHEPIVEADLLGLPVLHRC